VSQTTEAVVFNGLPLLLLAAAYASVTGAVLPVLWRDRARAHPLDWALVLVFPGVAVAAGIFGVLVLQDGRPFGGHTWLSFAACLAALIPAVLLLARWGDRAFVVGGIARTREAEERVSARDRELSAVAEISNELVRARDDVDVSRPLVRHAAGLLDIGFAGVATVDEDAAHARGAYAEAEGEEASSWREITVDLRNEPSGIASAVFDAAPVAVFDVASSPLVSPRLAKLVGAQSGAWIPMIAEERVVGVLVVATTREKRAFSSDEVALLQAIAAEAALALDRLRSAAALSDALEREKRIGEIVRRVRAELDPDAVVRVAREELRRTLRAHDVAIAVGTRDADVRVERPTPLTSGEAFLVETVGLEVQSAHETARLIAENQRRLEQQAALLHAAQVVTSELELESVLQRLVEEVTKLLRADAADCYLLDTDRGLLRCAAVHGFDASLVGFEFTPEHGAAGAALRSARPVAADDYSTIAAPVPHAAYRGFSRAVVAPMVWAGETRGVLGVGNRDSAKTFSEDDIELLDAFASLASLALRNAESYAESSRQARVQRGFYRIASLLGEPLSLAETYDTAAQAAAEALGGDFAAVLVRGPSGLALVGGHALPRAVRELDVPQALLDAAGDIQVLASPSVADDERFAEWARAPFASLLAIPVPGERPGLVLVFFATPRAFARDDLELAQQLAAATRGALDRSRLFEAERAARALSQQLARTGSLLATELDPVAVLEAVVEEAVRLLGVDAAALAALDGDELVVTAAVGDGADSALGARSASTGWVAGDVVQSRAPVAYEDAAASDGLADSDVLLAHGHRAYLGVPLAARDAALHGVLSVYGREPRAWREEEIQALVALAANASVALSNAELYQRVAVEREQSVAILANIADGIVAVDRDGDVVLWNRAAEEITGVPASEAIGRTPVQVLQRELESETGGTNRLVAIPRGGDEVWLSLSEAVMRDPTGAVAGRIFAFRDISAEHVVEQMKSDFVSTVSVELRTPLTSIYGFAQTLLREDVAFGELERRTFLEFIARESERLTTIVDALLDVARIETGDLSVRIEPTDIAAVVGDVLETAEVVASNGHRFVTDLDVDGVAANADPDKLRQVLDQLISNAVKYSPKGGTVTVSARRRDAAIEVAVEDEGIGIPAAERERIFTKFYKPGGAPGTGLGLFIARGLVREMGGRMWVDSEEGRGSRFAFELPLAENRLATTNTEG
jgi:PAS domain S-box-containing protein